MRIRLTGRLLVALLALSFAPLALACPCSSGIDNFCLHGPSTPGCPQTYPGGYCDPNGDGSFSDADWNQGWYDYQAACSGGGSSLPDTYIEDLWWTPSNPAPGDQVQFHVRVRNGGNAGTGADVGVGYWVNGSFVGWGIRGPMYAGEVSSNFGMVQRWTASSGSFTVRAMVDDIDRYTESNEGNNVREETLTVSGGSGCGVTYDLAQYVISTDPNRRVYSRLKYPSGATADEVFGYRDGGWSGSIDRWYFVKNTSGENWEEFGFDSNYIYRYRDTSWANTCTQNGAAAYYQLKDSDRSSWSRWAPRYMQTCSSWSSPWTHTVDAGYKRTNSCSLSCSSPYEGTARNELELVAHHATYTTIWGYTVNDVIEIKGLAPDSDHFFYAKNLGLVGFEGPAGNNEGRFASGAYSINYNVGGAPNWVSLCGY